MLSQKDDGTRIEVNIKPRPFLREQEGALHDYGLSNVYFAKQQSVICVLEVNEKIDALGSPKTIKSVPFPCSFGHDIQIVRNEHEK